MDGLRIFPLNSFPHSLTAGIFEYLSPEELLKCLQINQNLRHFVLNNGPFQRRLLEMRISARFDEVVVSDLRICLTTDDGHDFCFDLIEKRDHHRTLGGRNRVPIVSTDSHLFRRLPFCRRLRFETFELNVKRDGRRSKCLVGQLLSFVPRFRDRCLEEFTLFVTNHRQGAAVLEAVHTQIVSQFSYMMRWSQEKIERSADTRFAQFFASNLTECSKISVDPCRLWVPVLFPDSFMVAKTRAAKINLCSRDEEDFMSTFRSLLKVGLPSRNPEARVKLFIDFEDRNECLAVDGLVASMRNHLRPLAKLFDDPIICQEILESFEQSPSLSTLLLDENHSLNSAYHYQRRFDEHLHHFYVLVHMDSSIHFYAQAVPIS